MTATLTSKGQLTIPKEIRDRMGLAQGDQIEFAFEHGITIVRKFVPAGENPFLRQLGITGPQATTAVERQREDRGWDDWDRQNLGQ